MVDTVCVGTVQHRHGNDIYLSRTEDGLYKQLRQYVNDYWVEEIKRFPPPPKGTPDILVVHKYFDIVDDEYLEVAINAEVPE